MEKRQIEGLVAQYRRLIDAMQGHTFYCEDDEGNLRRWYPPARPLLDRAALRKGEDG